MADQDKSNNLFDGSGLMDRTQIYAQRKSAGQSARRVQAKGTLSPNTASGLHGGKRLLHIYGIPL